MGWWVQLVKEGVTVGSIGTAEKTKGTAKQDTDEVDRGGFYGTSTGSLKRMKG